MVILLNIGDQFLENNVDCNYFIRKVIQECIQQQPDHHFCLFVNKNRLPDDIPSGKNLSVHSYHIGSRLFYRQQLRRKLRTTVRNVKADAVFSFDGSHLPTSSKLKQCLLLLNEQPEKKVNAKKMNRVQSIVVLSEVGKQKLINKAVMPEKIFVVHGAPKESYYPISEDEKIGIKEKYTEGSEFFIYKGKIAQEKNIIQLLKAFSIFKKRQKSSMKLVLAGEKEWKPEDFKTLISTYKYREDIIITDQLSEDEMIKICCSAYAFVYPAAKENNVLFGLDVMKGGLPVIISETLPLKEIAGTAASYFNALDVADIADKMMLIYKDEALRSRMIIDAKAVVDGHTWQRVAATIWQSMEAGVN